MLIFIHGERDIGERLTCFQTSKPDAGNIYYDMQRTSLTTAYEST